MIESIIAAYFAFSAPQTVQTPYVSSEAQNASHAQAQAQPVDVYMARVTAYSLPGTMASGKEVYFGAVGCPRAIPLGTRVEIGDLGHFICEDRTAKHNDGTFDVWIDDYDAAIQFGVRYLSVTVDN